MIFETGLNLFSLNQLPEASQQFHKIARTSADQLYNLAQIYLIRIALIENQPQKARALLSDLQTSSEDRLSNEKKYLEGLCSYQLGEFEEAISFLEKTLPAKEAQALPYLVKSYIKGVKDPRMLAQAQSKMDRLLQLDPSESSYILLGHLYLKQAQLLQDKHALDLAKGLLKNREILKQSRGKRKRGFCTSKLCRTLPTGNLNMIN